MEAKAKLRVVGGAFLAAALALSALLGWAFGWGNGVPWMMWEFGWMWFMPLFMVAFWGLVIWAVVALAQGLSRPGGSDSGLGRKDSAQEILRRRYALGEITREEYQKLRGNLI